MQIDIRALLSLPADERLMLAEMLTSSVGYPADIDSASVPAWRQAEMQRHLDCYATDEPLTRALSVPRGTSS